MRENKSTNVRFLMARAVASLGEVFPGLASRYLEPLFRTTPPPRPMSESAREVLAGGARFSVFLDGKRIAAWRWGQAGAPTVLLAHGWGGRAAQLSGFVDPLVTAGLSVVAFDAPGHGESSGSRSSLPELARAIAAVAGAVGSPIAVIAHSLGAAATALAIARGALRVGRVVLVAPPGDALTWFRGFAGALRLSPVVEARTRARVEERVGAPLAGLNVGALAPALNVPALIIHDVADRKVPWSDGAAYAAAAPAAALHTTRGLGHDGPLRDPDTVARAVTFAAAAEPRDEDSVEVLERELFERDRRWTASAS